MPDRYWQAFSTIQGEVLGATVLENRHVPILEVNAGYPNAPGQIHEIKGYYAGKGRPAVLILPEGSSLELEASNAQFVAHAGFAVLECEPDLEPNWTGTTITEQVGWAAARSLAQTWCDQVGARGWEVSVSSQIARVMPGNSNILAYLAFEADRLSGMGIALEGSVHWLAGETQAKRAIIKRAALDLSIPVRFRLPFEFDSEFLTMPQLERYVVWTEAKFQ